MKSNKFPDSGPVGGRRHILERYPTVSPLDNFTLKLFFISSPITSISWHDRYSNCACAGHGMLIKGRLVRFVFFSLILFSELTPYQFLIRIQKLFRVKLRDILTMYCIFPAE